MKPYKFDDVNCLVIPGKFNRYSYFHGIVKCVVIWCLLSFMGKFFEAFTKKLIISNKGNDEPIPFRREVEGKKMPNLHICRNRKMLSQIADNK